MFDDDLVASPMRPLPLSSPENKALESLVIYTKTKREGSHPGYKTNISTAGSLSLSPIVVICLDLISWKVELTFVPWL